MEVDSRVFRKKSNIASKGKRRWKISCWEVRWIVTLQRPKRRVGGREEDASSVFDVGVKHFIMIEYTVELVKITFIINKVSVQISSPPRGLL